MLEKVQISIIIPIYNVALYIDKCLHSILKQDLECYEVIMVNDGSVDNSGEIAQKWCIKHKQFKLINHKKNMGLSAARNTGLNQANGEFVTFIDSDDYLKEGTLKQCLIEIDNSDVIEYPIQKYHCTSHSEKWSPNWHCTTFKEWINSDGFTHCYACNKIYRMKLWQTIRFPIGLHFEDILTIPKVLQKANNIKGTTNGLYYYCERNNSISKSLNIKNLRDFTTALVELMSMPENVYNYKLYIRALNAQRTYQQYGGKEILVPRKYVPWSYIFDKTLTNREQLKFLWYKITLHA